MDNVLILDANQRSALAVTRTLGNHGVYLVTADVTPTSLSGCSRYSRQYITYPPPQSQPNQFVSSIAKLCLQHKISIIIPMTERVQPVARVRLGDFLLITLIISRIPGI